jgi:hypothetical protein
LLTPSQEFVEQLIALLLGGWELAGSRKRLPMTMLRILRRCHISNLTFLKLSLNPGVFSRRGERDLLRRAWKPSHVKKQLISMRDVEISLSYLWRGCE